MANQKMTDDGPALRALRELGYETRDFSRLRGKSSFRLTDPNGVRCKIKIQKSGSPTGRDGRARYRHRYGIAFKSFKAVDYIVFWAKNKRFVYIVPTTFLSRVMQTGPAKILQGIQWEAHIYFDRHELAPTDFFESISLRDYARSVSIHSNGQPACFPR